VQEDNINTNLVNIRTNNKTHVQLHTKQRYRT